jgi:hypothetical protein
MKIKITLFLLTLAFSCTSIAQVSVSLTVAPGTVVCDNESVIFTAAITGCPSAYTIYWKDNVFIRDTTYSPSTTWNTMLFSGSHGIWCTVDCNPNGSGNSSIINMTSDNCSGIEEYENGTLLTLYPNPSSGNIIIETEKLQMFPASLSVFDISGRVVGVDYEIKKYTIVLNAKQLEDGIYYYRIADKDSKKTATGKFVISK